MIGFSYHDEIIKKYGTNFCCPFQYPRISMREKKEERENLPPRSPVF
jgi:hypothetical protein